jgi:hypothetical protein
MGVREERSRKLLQHDMTPSFRLGVKITGSMILAVLAGAWLFYITGVI